MLCAINGGCCVLLKDSSKQAVCLSRAVGSPWCCVHKDKETTISLEGKDSGSALSHRDSGPSGQGDFKTFPKTEELAVLCKAPQATT